MQLAELHRTSYWRPSGSVVVPFERYNQHRISGTERSPSSSSLKRSCQVAHLCVALLQFIMAAFEATRVRPPATLVDYLCMLHVLTDVRSSRALRLWSASQFRRQIAAGSSGTQLSSALEHSVQRETTGAAQREWKWPRACAASPHACGVHTAASLAQLTRAELQATECGPTKSRPTSSRSSRGRRRPVRWRRARRSRQSSPRRSPCGVPRGAWTTHAQRR